MATTNARLNYLIDHGVSGEDILESMPSAGLSLPFIEGIIEKRRRLRYVNPRPIKV